MIAFLRENHNCVNKDGVIDEGLAHGRVDVNPEHRQIVIQRPGATDTEQNFGLGNLNVVNMRGRTGEVVEALTRKKVDVYCV